ncbi:factor-independent urate hydroxylase [Streptomyces sp. RFCAC02]|uniref:factor-independent urate hydroxylase n=1 Tax=Streptomyces sp. RFCAC02 TaxID=2499143 RepID=UPI00101F1452|nr:urate oxidase [Streptomyces sp. RFCAC02]
MPPALGPNQYGKAETRVLRVSRDGPVHHVRDLSVSCALSGDLAAAHLDGSNADVLPTDTMKNTVFAFAREHGIASPEAFAALLARHFVASLPAIDRARVRVEEYAWDRLPQAGTGAHSFVRGGHGVRTAQVTLRAGGPGRWEVLGGVTGVTVMNTTDSSFCGFARDRFTTLRETDDRVLATDVTAVWRQAADGPPEPGRDFDADHAAVTGLLLEAFAGSVSSSLQQTLYDMGARVIDERPEIAEIRLSLPNNHHFPVDLEPFGLRNETSDGAVYYAADRPYGLIEATVLRDGAEARIPADLTAP